MVLMNEINKQNLTNVFVDVCNELQGKVVEKETYFRDLQREAVECDFNVFANLCDVVASHYDALERNTIVTVFRHMQAL